MDKLREITTPYSDMGGAVPAGPAQAMDDDGGVPGFFSNLFGGPRPPPPRPQRYNGPSGPGTNGPGWGEDDDTGPYYGGDGYSNGNSAPHQSDYMDSYTVRPEWRAKTIKLSAAKRIKVYVIDYTLSFSDANPFVPQLNATGQPVTDSKIVFTDANRPRFVPDAYQEDGKIVDAMNAIK